MIIIIQNLLFSLALSLALTLILESGFFFIAGKRNKKDLLLVLLVNVITNPIVVLFYHLSVMFTDLHRVIIIIPLELFAIICEGWYYKKYGMDFKRPFLFAISANVFSYGVGLILQLLNIF